MFHITWEKKLNIKYTLISFSGKDACCVYSGVLQYLMLSISMEFSDSVSLNSPVFLKSIPALCFKSLYI